MDIENFKIKLDKEMSRRKYRLIILLSGELKYYFDLILEPLKFMIDKGMGGVYITSNRPYLYIANRFEKYDIEICNLFFIDTVSCMAGESPGKHGRCVFIENPIALEKVGMWAGILMERIDTKNKFLIIDSLSTLLIYNDSGKLNDFGQFLINLMHLNGSSGVFAIG